jgi:hypothetical protein
MKLKPAGTLLLVVYLISENIQSILAYIIRHEYTRYKGVQLIQAARHQMSHHPCILPDWVNLVDWLIGA